jgi:hypothetical protein
VAEAPGAEDVDAHAVADVVEGVTSPEFVSK